MNFEDEWRAIDGYASQAFDNHVSAAQAELAEYLKCHGFEYADALAEDAIQRKLAMGGPQGNTIGVEISACHSPDGRPWVITVSGADEVTP